MHELSIAAAILEKVEEESKKRAGAHCVRVGIRLGELSGVDPDALSFGFEALVKDSDLEPLALEIEFRERQQKCPSCGHIFAAKDSLTTCPNCGELKTECIRGNELDIAYLELEEP